MLQSKLRSQNEGQLRKRSKLEEEQIMKMEEAQRKANAPLSPIQARIQVLHEQVGELGLELSVLVSRLTLIAKTEPRSLPTPVSPEVPFGDSPAAEALSQIIAQVCEYNAAVKGLKEIIEV